MSFALNGPNFTPPNEGGSIQLTADPTNPAPRFNLNADTAAGWANGAADWNGQANGSNVTFQQAVTFGPGNWVISTAWPKATVTYQTSGGHVKTQTIDVSDASATAVAVTSYLPDYDASGNRLIAAAAAVTLINTNGSYTVGNNSYPLLDPTQPNFLNALTGLGTHESGHGFGLDDRHGTCGDPMSQFQANAANPASGTNDQTGCQTSNISCCDNNEIQNSPTNFYCGANCPPPPPPGPGGTACPAPTPTCSDGTLAQCDYFTGKWQCINPGDCLGPVPVCADGSDAVCYNGTWSCGTVTTSQCVGAQPTCPDGSPADCDGDFWTCPTPPCTDVCDPACPNYDPNDPSCSGGCDPDIDPACGGGCDPTVDPSCGGGGGGCDPTTDPTCGGGGGGGGGCDTDCCMSVSPCDVACSTVPFAQRQFWNTPLAARLRLKKQPAPKPKAGGPVLASAKPATGAVKLVARLQLPAAAEGKNLSATAFLQLASGSPARGSAAAPITIVEFSDFECPFCKAMAATLAQQVLPAEGSNVRLVFKNFPLQFHPWAEQAAEIGECVRRQNEDAFWQLHDFFFDHQRSLTVATLEQQALEFLGSDPSVNLEQVKACMARHEANAVVMRDIAQGQQSDVHGTPTLFINGIRVNGAQNVTLIRKAIAEARAELKPANNAHVGEFTGFWPDVDGSQLNCEVAVGEGVNPCLLF